MTQENNEALPDPLKDVLFDISQVVEDWKQQNQGEQLRASIFKLLDAQRDKLVYHMLGIETAYGQLEIKDDSVLIKAIPGIMKAQQDAVQAFISSVKLPKLTGSLRNSVNESLRYRFEETLEKEVTAELVKIINQRVKDLTGEITKSISVSNYIQIQKLLVNPNEESP